MRTLSAIIALALLAPATALAGSKDVQVASLPSVQQIEEIVITAERPKDGVSAEIRDSLKIAEKIARDLALQEIRLGAPKAETRKVAGV